MQDYIELGPDDVIQEEDHWTCSVAYDWGEVAQNRRFIGTKVSEHLNGYRFRRPRSTLIRDAAIELLRALDKCDYCGSHSDEALDAEARLREVLKEELRGEA